MQSIVGEAQVCVIGAGVMGLSAAYQMALRGLDVLVVEKSRPGAESSAANAGTLGIQNKPLAAIPLVMRSIQMWRQLSDELGVDVEYEKRGGFRVAHTTDDIERLEAAVQSQRAMGVATEMVYQPELSRVAPYLAKAVLGGSFCADDGMANPLSSVRALLRGAASRGVRVWHPCRVTGIEATGDDRFVLRTERGAVRCATVLSAAGAWNGCVARMLGVSLPVTAEVLQVVTTDRAGPILPHIVTHIRGNLTVKQSRSTGKVLIGGAWRGDGDLDTGRKRLRRDSLIGNLEWACQNIPAIAGTTLLRGWVGFEGRTPDKLLLSGSVGSPKRFHVLGCAAGGYTLSPIAGVLAARHILGEASHLPSEIFDVRRFVSALDTRPASQS
jgi:glycine/D-amino acid oxidase-like deaminating enzyme